MINILTHVIVGAICILLTAGAMKNTLAHSVEQTERAIEIAEEAQDIAGTALDQRDACILELEKLANVN